MSKYQGIDCPICKKPLENGEAVAFCPDCGAPYHRACIVQEGSECIYDELHAAGKTWENPNETKNTEYGATYDIANKCPRCGVLNPASGLFCEVCGTPLKNQAQGDKPDKDFDGNRYRGNAGYQIGEDAPQGEGFQVPLRQMPMNPYTTPFAGLDPEDTIDDVPIKDVAIFVGQNTPYFLPKFKLYSEQKGSLTLNWSAFFFQGIYFLYRKMYLWGALIVLMTMILSTPAILVYFDQFRTELLGKDPMFQAEVLLNLNNTLSTIRLMLQILMAFFTNRLYKSHCMKKIKSIQQENLDRNAYVVQLIKRGSISMKALGILVIACILLSYLLVFASTAV